MKTFARDFLIFIAVLGGCYLFYKHSGFFLYQHNSLQYMPDMYRTQVLIPFREYQFFEDGSGARIPPEGTLSINGVVYPHAWETPAAEIPRKSNPLPKTKEVLEEGEYIYDTYCVVCHGPKGLGNGYVVPTYPQPPSLQSDKIRDYADSQIYHVITAGQNSMMSYAKQVKPMQRWAAIHYIRALQLAYRPGEDDLEAYEESTADQEGEE